MLSVIVPVYNVEKYLRKCLDSILNQTLRDIEIICINDCSTDSSLSILKEYEKIDNRITVIDLKENKGVSNARNEGLKTAKGEYVGFVDSDDYIDTDFYKFLIKRALESGADIVKSNTKVFGDGVSDSEVVLQRKSFRRIFVKSKKYQLRGVIWNGIWKRSLITDNNLSFESSLVNFEDELFNLQTGFYCNKVVVCPSATYNYVLRSNTLRKTDKIDVLIKMSQYSFDFINQNGFPLYYYCSRMEFVFGPLFKNFYIKNQSRENQIIIFDQILKLFCNLKNMKVFKVFKYYYHYYCHYYCYFKEENKALKEKRYSDTLSLMLSFGSLKRAKKKGNVLYRVYWKFKEKIKVFWK